ncbi:MAG: fibronectin type III domain-containing protein [Fimbriimonadaceae bacterium]|nr:fibronectin type III domain-containing protein [Fimbriimonadaceae bacterium]
MSLQASVVAGQSFPDVPFASNAESGAPEIIVKFRPGSTPSANQRPAGLIEVDRLGTTVLYRASDDFHARTALSRAQGSPNVLSAWPNQWIAIEPRQFTPNDPLYVQSGTHPGQWNLSNLFGAPSINVEGAWLAGFTGYGTTIGVIDDGFDFRNPDIGPNFNLFLSYDYANDDVDPSPTIGNIHGTMMAGLAAGRGGNGLGITGVAPYAEIAGIRIGLGLRTDMWQVVQAIEHDSESVSIKLHGYGLNNGGKAAKTFMSFGAASAAQGDSSEQGVIHIHAAGNDRGKVTEDANKWDIENDPSSITVAAVGSSGQFSPYSSFGSNLTVCAPSNGGAGSRVITSTSVLGRGNLAGGAFTNQFTGTSAAAAAIGGVIALGRQANPYMDTRMAKHLLVQTSIDIDEDDRSPSSDGGWRANGAGYTFNPNYGHGLVDATAFVEMASRVESVSDMEVHTQTLTPNRQIPDNNANGLRTTFQVTDDLPLEDVLIRLQITHPRRGDLEAYLTSPRGYRSKLFTRSTLDGTSNINWEFSSMAFWGEDPQGEWTLTINDRRAGSIGTLNRVGVELRMGSLTMVPDLEAPSDLLATPGIDQVELDWIDNSDNEYGFKVYMASGSGEFFEVAETSYDETNVIVSGLNPDTPYRFFVTAFNLDGESYESNHVETRTLELVAPLVRIEDVDLLSMAVAWDYDALGVSFEVQRVAPELTQYTEEQSVLFEDLVPATTYSFKVRARMGAPGSYTYSPWSNQVTARTLPVPVPQGLVVDSVGYRDISVSWDYSEAATYYQVEVVGGQLGGTEDSFYYFEGLTPGTGYNIRVRSLLGVNGGIYVSDWSPNVFAMTLGISAPANLRLVGRTTNSLSIAWDHPGWASPDLAEGFVIDINGTMIDADEFGRSYLLDGLQPDTTYAIRVGAYYEGEPVWSGYLSARTDAPVNPAPVFSLGGRGREWVRLNWTHPGPADRFEIQQRYKQSDGTWTGWVHGENVPGNLRSAQRDGLRANTLYRFRNRAHNSIGASAWSNEVEVRTTN